MLAWNVEINNMAAHLQQQQELLNSHIKPLRIFPHFASVP
jgi:hypothetical protein